MFQDDIPTQMLSTKVYTVLVGMVTKVAAIIPEQLQLRGGSGHPVVNHVYPMRGHPSHRKPNLATKAGCVT